MAFNYLRVMAAAWTWYLQIWFRLVYTALYLLKKTKLNPGIRIESEFLVFKHSAEQNSHYTLTAFLSSSNANSTD